VELSSPGGIDTTRPPGNAASVNRSRLAAIIACVVAIPALLLRVLGSLVLVVIGLIAGILASRRGHAAGVKLSHIGLVLLATSTHIPNLEQAHN
jgi:uncharacterized membrane protein YdbT with pleckstrin-like domain